MTIEMFKFKIHFKRMFLPTFLGNSGTGVHSCSSTSSDDWLAILPIHDVGLQLHFGEADKKWCNFGLTFTLEGVTWTLDYG